MRRCFWLVLGLSFIMGCQNSSAPSTSQNQEETTQPTITLAQGTWRAVMKSPGGELPFRLEIKSQGDNYHATAHNGDEVVLFDNLTVDSQGHFRMAIDHYDSVFEGTVNPGGTIMSGTWRKVVDHTRTAELGFEARHGLNHRFKVTETEPPTIASRWEVTFSPESDEPGPAVAEFQQEGAKLTGTFLTPTGDYRFLAGNVDGNQLFLSCFDGGHAFLFKANLGEDGMLHGEFWSSDKWHETWIAKPNPEASLPDAMTLTHMNEGQAKFRFEFPDLEGNMVNQDDPRFRDKVVMVTIFGSWCPNCNDEAPFLQDLYQTYQEQGLEVLGLAFEATGNAERDTRMLRRFKKRHGLNYHLLLAGQRDKSAAGAKLPDINHVLAYPTTLFINRDGQVAHIHTGFTGPGTGTAYEDLKKSYHEMIRSLL